MHPASQAEGRGFESHFPLIEKAIGQKANGFFLLNKKAAAYCQLILSPTLIPCRWA